MRIWTSILAGLQVISGGLGALELADAKMVGLFVLVVAGLQAATVIYMKGDQAKRPQTPVEP
jgi:hypothetical protein